MLCPSCHTPNRDNAKFCKKCGLPFVPEIGDSAPAKAQEDVAVPTVAAPTPAESSSAPAPSDAQASAENKAVETPAQNVVSASDASTPDAAAVDQTAAPATPSPAVKTNGEEDIALAPTQILSPDKMMELQMHRWQHEVELEHQQPAKDVAEMPTIMMQPVGSNLFTDATILPVTPAPRQPERSAQPDIAEMPTVLITPGEIAPPPPASGSSASEEAATILPESEGQLAGAGEIKTGETQEARKTTPTTEMASPPSEAAPSPSQEEDGMEHVSSTNNQPPQESQSAADRAAATPEQGAAQEDFALLESGTLLAGRYEVAQVISEDATEHVYSVVDKQGYQHCWNCGSEENAEGDEFCMTCGAELLNASYTLHEYPASASGDSESHVLHGTIINTFVEDGHTYVIEQAQATQISSPNGIRLVAASDSDAGDVRRSEVNEDSTLVLQLQRVHESIAYPSGIFIVADGMGGHDAGQLASHMAIGTIAERLTRELIMPPLTTEKAGGEVAEQTEDVLVELLHGAVEDANTAICQKNQQAGTDMGSTITGFMIVGDLAYIFNVGDSRTYMQRDGKLYQLTNDHSLVGQLVAGGLIEPDDVYTHPQRSQIYRSLGDKLNVQIDIFKQQVTPGDILLSCSDGLWEMVRNPQITDIFNNAPDPHTACTRLIEAANANGGEDNVSAVVVFVR